MLSMTDLRDREFTQKDKEDLLEKLNKIGKLFGINTPIQENKWDTSCYADIKKRIIILSLEKGDP